MAETTPDTPVATQKRPLEEPSSPSGPTDQPDAKRPALDKILKEEGVAEQQLSSDALESVNDTISKQEAADDAAGVKTEDGEPAEVKDEDDATDRQGDTVVPDAPANGAIVDGGFQHVDESKFLHVRAIISSAEAATVIGKGGENVSQIRRMSGAKCTVSEYNRGAVERILTVSGKPDFVAKAFGLIIRTLNQEPLEEPSNPQSKTYPLRLLIPHILIGSIIGKQGVRIREIQGESGARLNASESCLPLSTERSLVVLGVADAVHIATYYVALTLEEQLIDRFGGPAASNYAGRHGGPQGVVPGGMQVVPYVPQHAGGQMGHPDSFRNKQHQQPPRTPANPYATPQYMHGQPQPQQPQMPGPYGAASPRTPYVGAGPQPAQPYGHVAPQPGAHAGPPQQPMQGMVPGQPITQQIFIPNDMVGAIIGKGGAKINEIRQLSGSVIKINEPQDNNNERLVTITGTQECNQMALYMLYSRLGESTKLDRIETPVWFRHLPPNPTTPVPGSGRPRSMATTMHPHGVPAVEVPSPAPSDASSSTQQGVAEPPRRSPRPGRSPARPLLRTAFRNFSGVATVVVGKPNDRARPQTQYLIHKELLTAASPFFAAALNSTFAEGLDQTVRLPEEKPESFEWFLQWLYTGTLTTQPTTSDPLATPPPHRASTPPPLPHHPHAHAHAHPTLHDIALDGDLRNTAGSPKYFLLLDLYALSDRLLTTPLSNHILTTIARLSESTNSVPTPSDTWILYDTIPSTSPLRTLILDLFAYKKTDKLLETHKDDWHPRFLRDLVVKLKRPGPEALERHSLVAWRPRSWSTSKACEGCKEVLKPGHTTQKQ
ncbi:hypothetical protein M409DRAFT_66695 [Zasmidium cellare ATCC 36951]|uniref:BTB domain-containing protein n=1 Tax=Zasmidium cellare ATCC 36951 TaxID=1080233 RepID=A0A6A6CJS7_ZASCE|nr:uncharacterized protein M409DRAFT_66695 [Zasmidium cellare ATCC 36951]KAF2166202.1 hypothetical protein M409DRAFT_66695 [Zasmidium cellare ATCC 36951]